MGAYYADATSDSGRDLEVLTWEGFGEAARDLSREVLASGFDAQVVIAIARGGVVLAGAMCYAMNLKLVDAINVEFYTGVNETLADPVLLAPMLDSESIQDQRLLVVDDVADSGRTLALVLKLLRGFGAEVRSAVLYTKPTTVVQPDFVWRHTEKWIQFPWSALPPVTVD